MLEDIDQLIEKIESSGDVESRENARRLAQSMLEFHGDALRKIIQVLEKGGHQDLIQAISRDDAAGRALLLHGLHPVDRRERVLEALRKVRPSLQAHGGDVELVSLLNGKAQLRLVGTCNGCASSTATVRSLIEDAVLREAPDVAGLEVL